ncbi:14247_t:CDS:1, partial [Gigaspora rosea]
MSGSEQYSDATIIIGTADSTIRADIFIIQKRKKGQNSFIVPLVVSTINIQKNDSNLRIRAAPTNNDE